MAALNLESNNATHSKEITVNKDDVYVPCGHGYDTGNFFTLPPNCNLIVVEPYGHGHNWDITKGEIKEYTQLSDAMKKSHIFKNPVLHSSEIIDILGPVAIYESGEKAPDLEYRLELDWKDSRGNYRDIRHSGLVPLSTFTSSAFTTKNIIDTLVLEDIDEIEDTGIEATAKWIEDNEKIYKFSMYPSPDMFTRFKTNEDIIGILDEFERKRTNYKFSSHFTKAYRAFYGSTSFYGGDYGYICQSLENLMALFPGTYIHIVCRTASRDVDLIKKQNREMMTHRVPYMSKKQLLEMSIDGSLAQLSSSNYGPQLRKTIKNQLNVHEKKHLLLNEYDKKKNRIFLKPVRLTKKSNSKNSKSKTN